MYQWSAKVNTIFLVRPRKTKRVVSNDVLKYPIHSQPVTVCLHPFTKKNINILLSIINNKCGNIKGVKDSFRDEKY